MIRAPEHLVRLLLGVQRSRPRAARGPPHPRRTIHRQGMVPCRFRRRPQVPMSEDRLIYHVPADRTPPTAPDHFAIHGHAFDEQAVTAFAGHNASRLSCQVFRWRSFPSGLAGASYTGSRQKPAVSPRRSTAVAIRRRMHGGAASRWSPPGRRPTPRSMPPRVSFIQAPRADPHPPACA